MTNVILDVPQISLANYPLLFQQQMTGQQINFPVKQSTVMHKSMEGNKPLSEEDTLLKHLY